MRAITDPSSFLDVLRCPVCGVELFASGPHTTSLTCGGGHRLPVVDGVLDTMAAAPAPRLSPGRQMMQFAPFVQVYERWWRPAFTAFGALSDPGREAQVAGAALGLGSGAAQATLLDVACGPGNTTRSLARVTGAARVVGLDYSAPMLAEATAAGRPEELRAEIGYVRADAEHVPFADGCFDGAQCAAALYLFSDPDAVVREIARVLRPGARLVGLTFRPPFGFDPGASFTGVRYTRPGELRRILAGAGFTDIALSGRGLAVRFRATAA